MKKLTCLIVLLFFTITSGAQTSSEIKEPQPTFILFMLRAEKNKAEYLKKTGKTEDLKALHEDTRRVWDVTMKDIKDHFSLYPVYYFADSNLTAIKEKRFEGILFDHEGKTYNTLPNSADFFIVYFGKPIAEIKKESNASDEQGVYQDVLYPNDGIVILNHNFTRIPHSRYYYHYVREKWRARRDRPQYNFYSERFGIGYLEMGKQLQDLLLNRKD